MSSAWTKGIQTLESVLQPEGTAFAGLSDVQKQGLTELKTLLTTFHDNKEEIHVPLELLKQSEKELDESTCYLLQSFGGVKEKKISLQNVVKKTINMSRFVKRISAPVNPSGTVNHKINLPSEWNSLPEENRKRLRQMLSWENLAKWDFNAVELDEVSCGHPLLFVGWALLASPSAEYAMAMDCGENPGSLDDFKGYGFPVTFHYEIPKVCAFLRSISKDYNDVPYHNRIHAADVVQTLHAIIQMGGNEYTEDIHIFALLIAATAHDVGHPGKNNNFQVHSNSKHAIDYNDVSCLENMHAAELFRRLMGDNKQEDINILSGITNRQQVVIRQIIVDAILHTDMTKHFTMLDSIRAIIKNMKKDDNGNEEKTESGSLSHEDRNNLICFMLHAADISNPAKPDPIFKTWTDKCLEEFFAQGDEEKSKGLPISPLCNRETTPREQSQIGFIQYVVKPTFVVLGDAVDNVKKDVLPIIDSNHDYWKSELKANAI